jgi:branched-chain amino acid transport system ATP-binding protein
VTATGTTSTIEARSVAVEFRGLRALGGIDLSLRQGETLGLIGPNGAGKSTLVNVLTGYQRPTTGSVWLGSQEITKKPPYRHPRLGIVRTFQSTRAFLALSVFENIEVGALVTSKSRRQVRAWARQVLEEAELWDLRDRPAGALSTGQAHRLGIARAVALRPKFLLLDEPAAGLNETESAVLVELLRGVVARGDVGMLIIEHNIDIVAALSNRIQVIDEGKTIGVGTPEEVQKMPAVLEAYLGKAGSEDAAA